MRGFDSRYRTFPDYILGITEEIWENRQIHTLRENYASDIHVRAPAGVVTGNEKVISATMSTLAEFSDRQLLGEDVIWSGNDDSGYLSSHRILSTATHDGDGAFGKATGKALTYRIIADCAARENVIYDEWIVRDLGAIVRQLDVDPKRFASDEIDAQGGPGHAQQPLSPETEPPAVYTGRGNDDEAGVRYHSTLSRVMNAELGAVTDEYDRAVELQLPGGVTQYGSRSADRFWMGLRSAFPSAKFEVHHQIGLREPSMPDRAALRWSLHGKHDGWGQFGAPSGSEVYVMGISHAEFGHRGLRREYILIDEVAVWKQILLG